MMGKALDAGYLITGCRWWTRDWAKYRVNKLTITHLDKGASTRGRDCQIGLYEMVCAMHPLLSYFVPTHFTFLEPDI